MAVEASDQQQPGEQVGVFLDTQPRLPLLSRLSRGASAYALKPLTAPAVWLMDWHAWLYPPEFAATIVKTYPCRPSLPIRIFLPKSYDPTSSKTPLSTLFSIHGGGFCVGEPRNDEAWNDRFANMHNMLVVALNYRKAPWYPFPTATHDIEALILAAFEDESLPIDKNRIAVGGFSAGGNLALGVCQLPSIREKVKPSAAVPIYAIVDHSLSADFAVKTRYYKPGLGPGMRGNPTDFLAKIRLIFDWSYINPGQNLRDPLLSPIFAPRDTLPPHILFVSAELDQLAHGTWQMASKLTGRRVPAVTEKVGQEGLGPGKGQFILDDERFAFEHVDEGAKTSVRWLLVPDQIHGFDRLRPGWHGSSESVEDAELKEKGYQKIMGEWLQDVVWK
ncbi:hypothetical protein AAE478_007470 [Parahypoxylon ruwenzoriense]